MARQTKANGRQRRNGQKPKHEQLAQMLKLQPFRHVLWQIREDYTTGRKGYDLKAKFACLVAMHLYNISCVTRFVAYLRSHAEVREACGISSIAETPSEDALYRFRKRMIEGGYATALAQALVDAAHEQNPDMGKAVAVDSTDVDAWCNKFRSKDRLRDRDAAWGVRLGPTGEHDEKYVGYKLHLMQCVDTETPIAWTITAANAHDSTEALPVFETARSQHDWFKPVYGLMDKGYDSEFIHKGLEVDFQCHPIIPLRDMRKTKKGILDENGKPYCEGGCWKWIGTDYDRKRSKWACPMTCSDPKACAGNKAKTCYLNLKDGYRNHSLVPRDTDKFKALYNKRGAVEREFSRLKDQYMLGSLRVQGIERVRLHFELALITRLGVHLVSNSY